MIKSFFTENNFFAIVILILLVIGSLLVSEFAKKKKPNIEREILRKVPHILIGVLFSLTPIFMTGREIIISAIILFFGVWIGRYSNLFKSVFSLKRISLGMWMTPLSLGVMSWIWLPEYMTEFLVGILVLTFADAFAAIFGKMYGEKKLPFLKKTFLGSSIFFITTFIIFLIFGENFSLIKYLFISMILTFFELILIFGLDNFILPILASYLFYWFS